jgi:hypothetical protein
MKTSSKLESLLKVALPVSYKNFIDNVGYLCLDAIGIEIYGYKPDFNIEKIPCVIAATKLNKRDYNLKENEIVLSHTGFEDYIVVLDTDSDFVFEVNLVGERRILEESFSNWLANLITQNNIASK